MWAILVVVLLVNKAAGSVLPPEARSAVVDGDDAAGAVLLPEDSVIVDGDDAAGPVSSPGDRSSILGGEVSAIGRWPWMVSLWITNGISTKGCSGSLLSDEWVLTAAFCLHTKRVPPIPRFSFARLGISDLKGVAEFNIGLSEFVTHPRYRHQGHRHDIALVRLEERVAFSPLVSPVTLSARGEVFWRSAECYVTGWGSDDYGETITLQQLKTPIIKQSVCKDQIHNLTPAMMCAANPSAQKDVCENDIGGPLVCRATCGFVQVGIASGEFNEHQCWHYSGGDPGVYTRLSKYVHYINNVTQCNLEASSEI